ncbi:MAG: hypothetical protein WCD86_15825 [Ktedonobacteraceae bacterium]|nr:hypothetical protein [Ktedonobacteraceae bacterium]
MNLNNIYNQEQFIARNVQERTHIKEAQVQEPRQHKPLFPAIKQLFRRRGAQLKQEEQSR